MTHTVNKHPVLKKHYYVDGHLVAGVNSKAAAVRVFKEAAKSGDPENT